MRVEFIEESITWCSWEFGLKLCGMGALKDNKTKNGQGVSEGIVLGV